MSNLPEGVTPKMIDDRFGGGRDDWPFNLECDHDDARGELREAFENLLGDDAEQSRTWEALDRLIGAQPTMFDDTDVAELSSWATASGAECLWTCPVCGQEREESADQDDFRNDD